MPLTETRTAATPEALAEAAAAALADAVAAAIDRNGRAHLAVPGSEAAEAVLLALSRAAIDWERVAVTLTEAPAVPRHDPLSAEDRIARTLFAGPAAAAEFVPLGASAAEPSDGIEATATSLRQIVSPLDACLLVVGTAGAVGGLRTGSTGLAEALKPEGAAPVALLRPPGGGPQVLALTLSMLAEAGTLLLLAPDDAAARSLAEVGEDDDTPLAALLAEAEALAFGLG